MSNGRHKTMLVSRNCQEGDFSKTLKEVLSLAEEHEVDSLLFAGWAYDRKNPFPDYEMLFKGSHHIKNVIIEVANVLERSERETLFFNRNVNDPKSITQRLERSADGMKGKETFISELGDRIIEDKACIICGEINTLTYSHKEKKILDPYFLSKKLKEAQVSLIFNFWHTYGRRYENNLKRKYLSKHGRTLLSVWNMGGAKGESHTPWCAFVNGEDRTASIEELKSPIEGRSDIRIGVFKQIQL